MPASTRYNVYSEDGHTRDEVRPSSCAEKFWLATADRFFKLSPVNTSTGSQRGSGLKYGLTVSSINAPRAGLRQVNQTVSPLVPERRLGSPGSVVAPVSVPFTVPAPIPRRVPKLSFAGGSTTRGPGGTHPKNPGKTILSWVV